MTDDQHVGENVGAYVLGALPAAEAHEIEMHAASCPQCQRELAELKQVVAMLPLACSSAEPPADLKEKILSATKAEDQVDAILRRPVAREQRLEPKRDFWHRPIPVWAGIAGWTGLAAACVVAGMFIGIANEHHRMLLALQASARAASQPQAINRFVLAPREDSYSVYSVNANQLEQAVKFIGQSQVWDLSVSKIGERIPCKVIQPMNMPHAMVVANADMPMPKKGMVYQVWLVREGKVHKGGIIMPMPNGMHQAIIPMRVHSGDVIAFTMEPAGGSAVPSGPFVMKQTL